MLLVLLLALPIAARAAALETYGRLPTIESAAISPDGQTIGMIWTNGEQRRIVVQPIGQPDKLQVENAGDVKVRSLFWGSPTHLMVFYTRTADIRRVTGPRAEYMMGAVYDTTTRKARPLMHDVQGGLNAIYGRPAVRTIAGKPVAFLQGVRFIEGRGRLVLFRVDLTTGRSEVVDEKSEDAAEWVVDSDGEVLARADLDRSSGRWRLYMRDRRSWRPVTLPETAERPDLDGLGRTSKSVLVRFVEDDRTVFREVDSQTLAVSEPLTLPGASPVRDPATHLVIGAYALVGDDDRWSFFSPQDQKIWDAVRKAYPDDRIQLLSQSSDRKRLVVRVDSPTEGPFIVLVDLNTRGSTLVGGVYKDLEPADVSPVRPIRFKAADGLELTGYLTVPRGKEARNLPLVVNPHGGPAARDTPGFDWWAQAMASRGYAVLQVNFRGSQGFGWPFLKAGFGQWGRKMQSDVSDGVRHLAAEGVIDPKRVCIVGASYGGYTALAGVTLEQGVYHCAASVGGLSDMGKMAAWSRRQGGLLRQRYLLRLLGAENARDDALDAISPALLADRAQAPVLLIHGRDDTVVPLEQSRYMADALKRAGKPAELVVLPGDDHWLSRGETRLQMLKSVVTFLETHNPPN
jgi:dipeptidyl aminopeptidase/acylaminoacyl peptidase